MGLAFVNNRKGKEFFCCKEMKEANEKHIFIVDSFMVRGMQGLVEIFPKYCPFCGTKINKEKALGGV